MISLLDTNVCIAFLNEKDGEAKERLFARSPDELCLCSVVKAELLFGARNSRRVTENLGKLEQFFRLFASLPFDDAAAGAYGQLRAQLEREGALIGPNDMMIAAIALSADATLVTRNTNEFHRVAGLRVETW